VSAAGKAPPDAARKAASSFWGRHVAVLVAALATLAACSERAPIPVAAGDADACGAPATSLHGIQGAGGASPLDGRTVVVEAIVTANFQRGMRGFFVQAADAERDDNPATSEGLFVAVADVQDRVHPGTRVRVRGRVIERREAEGQRDGTTAIESDQVRICGEAPLPAPVELTAPPADWERLEGMRVNLPGPVTVAGNYELLRFGRLDVSLAGRPMSPTEVAAPGPDATAVAARNAQVMFQLDDARTIEDPRRIWWLDRQPSPDAPWRAGTTLSGIEGVLDQGFRYRLQLTAPPRSVVQAARPTPPDVGGDLRVASFNLLTFFNGDGRGGGFPTARGATDPAEFARQRDKLVTAILGLRPDVAALMEIENDGYGPDSAIAQLVAALNVAAAGAAEYRFVDPRVPKLGGDEIAVGMIYNALRVEAVGAAMPLSVTIVPAKGEPDIDTRNRVPLVHAFRARTGGTTFTLVANHFKSKNCGDARGADTDQSDGQACWNATRARMAERQLIALRWTSSNDGQQDILILGDLNAYGKEDPVRRFRDAGFVDLVEGHATEPPYSFVYNALSGRLDHALATPSLAARVTGAAEWHINADELAAFDFNREGRGAKADARLYRPDPYRSSDHDPLVIGLRAR
jgi:predicted extracellular nuclease